jgi:tetratricopeptide (TPR) repeat protein
MEGIVTTLLQQRCFLSATIYCDFWISDLQHRIASNSASGSIELELRTSHSLCGDAYQGLKQGRRAMSYYERALSFRATSAAHSAAALQLKIAECALALVDVASFSGQSDDAVSVGIATDALVALETIPLRSLPMHLLLARARLQEDCGRLSDAAQTLSTALSVQPHCIEAALSLIRIFAQHTPGTVGAAPLVDLQRIISVYSTLSQQTNESSAWTVKFIEAHAAFAKYQHRTTLDLLAELDAAYPRCLPVLALTAQAQVNPHISALSYSLFFQLSFGFSFNYRIWI